MNQNLEDFKQKFDGFTKSIANSVTTFFKENYNIENFSEFPAENELNQQLLNWIETKNSIAVNNLKLQVEKKENGYIGSVKCDELNKPLFFEIIW